MDGRCPTALFHTPAGGFREHTHIQDARGSGVCERGQEEKETKKTSEKQETNEFVLVVFCVTYFLLTLLSNSLPFCCGTLWWFGSGKKNSSLLVICVFPFLVCGGFSFASFPPSLHFSVYYGVIHPRSSGLPARSLGLAIIVDGRHLPSKKKRGGLPPFSMDMDIAAKRILVWPRLALSYTHIYPKNKLRVSFLSIIHPTHTPYTSCCCSCCSCPPGNPSSASAGSPSPCPPLH